jgi:uncharacterized protein (DUF58 family)
MKHPWRPTTALVRAGLGSLALAMTAVLAGRSDLLVLATPLLVCTAGALQRRPRRTPRADTRLVHESLREGEGTTVRATLADSEDVEHVVVALTPHKFVATKPRRGARGRTMSSPSPTARVAVALVPLRWGARLVGDGLVGATSPWAGFRWGPAEVYPKTLTTLPMPGYFDSTAPAPHPIGLVGTNPARRTGDGTEFASIRPFNPGDRLRRVQWRVSLRTGSLHVTSTLTEEDSNILLVLDALAEIGASGGIHGPSSSLDIGVRAAGAVADHYLHRGDRVGLRVLGTTTHTFVGAGAGKRHHRRILDTLARVTPGAVRSVDARRLQFGTSAGTTVIVFSPMLSDEAVNATVTLARRGLSVVVVDTIPEGPDLGDDDPRLRLAWRLRLVERQSLLRRVQAAGIPVVTWRGPGTLDEVLRRLGRRAAQPRMVRR